MALRFPRWYARFNKTVTNKIVRLWAGRAPGMGVLRHNGRKSGTFYRTPLVVFPLDVAAGAAAGYVGEGVVVQVGYGPKTDWLKNVLHAGGAEMEYGGRVLKLGTPALVTRDEARTLVPRTWKAFYRVVPFPDAAVFVTSQPS